MPGPYSSDHRSGANTPIPASPPPPPPAPYPGPTPAVPFPQPRRRGVLVGATVALLVGAAVIAAVLRGTHHDPVTASGAFTDATAAAAIQTYLNALQHRDTEVIARNTLCGIYDAVRDRRTDQALAKLSSDAFRKQFSEATVTSVDKIVYWSDYQAQVLFTMRVQPPTGSNTRSEVQGVAQLLSQQRQILVCSYVLHSAGMF